MDGVDFPALLADPSYFDIISDWEDTFLAEEAAKQYHRARHGLTKRKHLRRTIYRLPVRDRLDINDALNSLNPKAKWVNREEMLRLDQVYNVSRVPKTLFGRGILGLPRCVVDHLLHAASSGDMVAEDSSKRREDDMALDLQVAKRREHRRYKREKMKSKKRSRQKNEAAQSTDPWPQQQAPFAENFPPEISQKESKLIDGGSKSQKSSKLPEKCFLQTETPKAFSSKKARNKTERLAKKESSNKGILKGRQQGNPEITTARADSSNMPSHGESSDRRKSKKAWRRGRRGRRHGYQSQAGTHQGENDDEVRERYSSSSQPLPLHARPYSPSLGGENPVDSPHSRSRPQGSQHTALLHFIPESPPPFSSYEQVALGTRLDASVRSLNFSDAIEGVHRSPDLSFASQGGSDIDNGCKISESASNDDSNDHVRDASSQASSGPVTPFTEPANDELSDARVQELLNSEIGTMRTREDRKVRSELRRELGGFQYAQEIANGNVSTLIRAKKRERREAGIPGPKPSQLEGGSALYIQRAMPWLYEEELDKRRVAEGAGEELAQRTNDQMANDAVQQATCHPPTDTLPSDEKSVDAAMCDAQLQNEMYQPGQNTESGSSDDRVIEVSPSGSSANPRATDEHDSPIAAEPTGSSMIGSSHYKPATRACTKSPYFPASHVSKVRKAPAGTRSGLPFPPLSQKSFGLIQERFAQNPFQLLVGCMFLNRTKGIHAATTFFKLVEKYPTAIDLAIADVEDVVHIIKHLGLQNQRATNMIRMASLWSQTPPAKGKRYRTLHYPFPKAGTGIRVGDILDDDDERLGAWEVAYLPGIGDYALDSWRIFCRDVLRGVADDWNGKNAHDGFEPEWKRVQPQDKELRAFLHWMWLREGWTWDPETGERNMADTGLIERAGKGALEWNDCGRLVDASPREAGDDLADDDPFVLNGRPANKKRKVGKQPEVAIKSIVPETLDENGEEAADGEPSELAHDKKKKPKRAGKKSKYATIARTPPQGAVRPDSNLSQQVVTAPSEDAVSNSGQPAIGLELGLGPPACSRNATSQHLELVSRATSSNSRPSARRKPVASTRKASHHPAPQQARKNYHVVSASGRVLVAPKEQWLLRNVIVLDHSRIVR